jgi:CBS domain-containing protein
MDRVRDWMTAQVITVGPEHSVAAAREIMWNRPSGTCRWSTVAA